MSQPYNYDQGDNETDYKWVRRLITRAAMLDRELADARERLRSSEADQRDAARYRWLRDTKPWPQSVTLDSLNLGAPGYWDKIIDAAMSAQSDKEEKGDA